MSAPIVVGVDGREGGRDALALAALLQRARGGELTAVHAYPYERFVHDAEHGRERFMHDEIARRLRAEVAAAGVEARTVAVPDPSPARALHLAAERESAELIVVGSAHHGALANIALGDVAGGTLSASPCAVAVAPRGFAGAPHALEEIGVGYDGEPEARRALAFAAQLAAAAEARLRVIAVARPASVPDPWIEPWHDWTAVAEAERERARRSVDEAVAELDVAAAGEIRIGTPSAELERASRELDLLVVGSRGFGPLRRLVAGSTSSRLVRSAACPVLVLPRSARDTARAVAAAPAIPASSP
jgi:nucleotide-binding universal stress UspA family protein